MRCPDLDELPPPPAGRTGWPWTRASRRTPPERPDGSSWPRISITTPSFNQAEFIEETIRSVLLQGYPDLEYSIFDGGSRDGSVDVIRKYEPWLAHWRSEEDRGQSHAINKGWSLATGDFISWLCSDDDLLPSCLEKVGLAAYGKTGDDVAMITGGVQATDERSRVTGERLPELPVRAPADISLVDHEAMYLPQPASFYARVHLDRVGRWVREELQYTMDREILYRLCRTGRVVLLQEPIATYREHADSKTVSATLKQHLEAPMALEYCEWGDRRAIVARRKVARGRIAKGHYLYAVASTGKWEGLSHLARAGFRRPGYLSPARAGTRRVILGSLGLLPLARALRRRRPAAEPELTPTGAKAGT